MISPGIPNNEEDRLLALHEYGILDSPDEQAYDDITTLASEICQTPIAVISLIDGNRQWFKSKTGISVKETERELSFCGHAILQPNEIMIVKDARTDDRFHDNPLVTGSPNIVFYAGVPLLDENGFALGTLCTIDNKPRELSVQQLKALKILTGKAIALLNLRKKNMLLEKSMQNLIDAVSFASPYYLLINREGGILSIGKNFKISNPEMEEGDAFGKYFQWISKFDSGALLSDKDTHARLLFFASHDQKQRYKCSVKKQDAFSYFVFASPVINTELHISNYRVSISHFPRHDYIAEYIFLQQAATKGLEDSRKLNELLHKKNKDLETSKNLLIKTNSVLEERVHERTKEIKNLALFPHQNPNATFEVSYEQQKIIYMNPAAIDKVEETDSFTFDLLLRQFKILPQDIVEKNTDKKEFEWKERIYERNMFFLEDRGVFRLYLHDITDIRKKEIKERETREAFIRQQNVLLDMRSAEQQISLEEKLRFYCRKTSEILQCDRCSVWFYNPQKTAISTGFIYQKKSNEFLQGTTILAKDVPDYFAALESKVVIDASDAENHPATYEFKDIYLRPLGIKSMLDIPLIQAEHSIGVICSEYNDKSKIFADDEISFARSVADVIVLAYETEQLKLSQLQLKEKNETLNAAMEKLVDMQEDLVQHEKMATLGLLIAGIAHEINTPLGAIKASNENLQTGLLHLLNEQFSVISPEILSMAVKLFALAKKESRNISTREERMQIKKIEEQIATLFPHLTNTNFFGRKLFDLGFDELENSLTEFLLHPENERIFDFSADLLKLIKSTYTIGLAAEKAGKVVKALNTFSHGNIENEISNFNLNENIESVITLLWNRIKYNTKLHNLISSEIIVSGNAEELSQVWTNIINNALQAANNGCNIWIDYSVDDNHHIISITNDGPAIPENILPKIFETFFSTKKRGEGTGLGLSIVKKIIEKHGGKIICESNPEKTTFAIYLPINP